MKLTFVIAAVLAVSAAVSPPAYIAAFGRQSRLPLRATLAPQFPFTGLLVQSPGFGSQPRLVARPTPVVPRPAAAIRVASNDQAAKVLRYENYAKPDGSYKYVLEIDNGITAQAQGTSRDFGGNPPVVPVVSQGSFSWISPEGRLIVITYVADENGYQPSGDAIPGGPPPAAIAKAAKAL